MFARLQSPAGVCPQICDGGAPVSKLKTFAMIALLTPLAVSYTPARPLPDPVSAISDAGSKRARRHSIVFSHVFHRKTETSSREQSRLTRFRSTSRSGSGALPTRSFGEMSPLGSSVLVDSPSKCLE